MRYFIVFLILINIIFATDVIEIKADSFKSDELKGISIFKGDVVITKGADFIKAEVLTIYFNSKREPIKYEAKGKVSFKLSTEAKSYSGNSKEIYYTPKEKEYILLGDAFIQEIGIERKIYGEKIMLNESSGMAEVIGDRAKPVKIIFRVDDNSSKK